MERGHIYKIEKVLSHRRKETLALLETKENVGRSQCLFMSILQYLEHRRNGQAIGASATDIRKAIVDFIILNWDDYVHGFFNFLDEHFQEEINDLECQQMRRRLKSVSKCTKIICTDERHGERT